MARVGKAYEKNTESSEESEAMAKKVRARVLASSRCVTVVKRARVLANSRCVSVVC